MDYAATLYGTAVSLGAIALFYFTGLVFLYCIKFEKTGLYRACCSFVCGIFIHGLVGLTITFFANKELVAQLLLSVLYISCVGVFASSIIKKRKFFYVTLDRSSLAVLSIWVVFVTMCNALVYSQIKYPDQLYDGPYIVKQETLPVKIQVLTYDLPADNMLPYLVTEYFMRDVDFRIERPILPGQEVTNRTILMSLVVMPFRAAMFKTEKINGSLGVFHYVGTDWPDISVLLNDQLYAVFVSIGLALNSLIFFAFLLLYKELVGEKNLIFAALIFVLTPYVFDQTIFIWPKNLAAFFILLALYRVISGEKGVVFTFFLLGLGYNSHPFGIVFLGGFGLYYVLQDWKVGNYYRTGKAIAMSVLMLAPWMIWSKLVLQLNSDLVMQNFIPDSKTDFVWARIYHLYVVWFPSFLEIYPFSPQAVYAGMKVCVPGIVGIFTFAASYYMLYQFIRSEHRDWTLLCLLLPLALILLIFSRPNSPIFHGYQVLVPVLMILAFRFFQRYNNAVVLVVFSLQAIFGLYLWGETLVERCFPKAIQSMANVSASEHQPEEKVLAEPKVTLEFASSEQANSLSKLTE